MRHTIVFSSGQPSDPPPLGDLSFADYNEAYALGVSLYGTETFGLGGWYVMEVS